MQGLKTIGLGALLALTLAGTAPVLAQQTNAGLPTLDQVRPLPKDPISNVQLSIETSFGQASNLNQPTKLGQKSLATAVGISADLGEFAFAGITGTYSHEDITSTNLAFAMPMAGVANVLGVDGVIGIKPVPFLSMGAMVGFGRGSASYTFTDFPMWPATPGDSSTRRLGAFLSAFYRMDKWELSATGTIADIRTNVDYGPGNIPQTDAFGSTLLLARLGARYRLTDQLTLEGGLTVNHVLGQTIASAQTGLDATWLTLEGGLDYALNERVSLNLTASTWLLNERMSFSRVAVGATYSF